MAGNLRAKLCDGEMKRSSAVTWVDEINDVGNFSGRNTMRIRTTRLTMLDTTSTMKFFSSAPARRWDYLRCDGWSSDHRR